MTKPIIKIHNAETNEVIEREMTSAEFAQYKIDVANHAAAKIEEQTNKTERQAILDRLGLTADEAKLLLG
jgi:hypothetical protein